MCFREVAGEGYVEPNPEPDQRESRLRLMKGRVERGVVSKVDRRGSMLIMADCNL